MAQPGLNDDEDAEMDEDIACNSIPLSNFKSNNIYKKEKFLQSPRAMSPGGRIQMEAPLSPGASNCMRDSLFRN